jgi:microcystin-dependent protein
MHAGSGPGLTTRRLGVKGGTETELLVAANLPSHPHPVILNAYSGRGNSDSPVGTVWAKKNRDKYYSTYAPDVEMRSGAIQLTVGDTGGSQYFNHMPPFTVVNYIMALYGLFPHIN